MELRKGEREEEIGRDVDNDDNNNKIIIITTTIVIIIIYSWKYMIRCIIIKFILS